MRTQDTAVQNQRRERGGIGAACMELSRGTSGFSLRALKQHLLISVVQVHAIIHAARATSTDTTRETLQRIRNRCSVVTHMPMVVTVRVVQMTDERYTQDAGVTAAATSKDL
jgi:hypothetical protein